MKLSKKTMLVAACLEAVLISTGSATTINWTNAAGGNWSVAANWSPNQVPGSSDDAVITNAGAYTVTLNTSPTVNTLTLGGGSGQQTLSLPAAGYTLTLNNASVVNPGGILALGGGVLYDKGGMNVGGEIYWTGGLLGVADVEVDIATNGILVLAGVSGNTYSLGQPLSNAGTVQLVSGDLQINYGYYGSMVNLPGGVVEITADVSIVQYGGGPGFSNQGLIVKSGGTGTSTIANNPFNNSGTVEANTGTISLDSAPANLSTGSLFIGAGQTVLSGGTAILNGSMTCSNLVLTGAVFEGNGVLYGTLVWTGGLLGVNNNTLTLDTNATLVVAGANGATMSLIKPNRAV